MSASRYDGRRPEPPYPTPQADAMQRASEVELIGDLLEALKAMLAHYGPPETVDFLCDYPTDHPITKARAAIAAATGEK